MEYVEVRINEWIREGFELYKRNFRLLFPVSLIAGLFIVLTLGLLTGPMIAGMIVVTLALYDQRKPRPTPAEVFRGFRFIFPTLIFTLFWGFIILVSVIILNFVPIIGQLASFCFLYGLQALLMFGFFLMVDHGLDFGSASLRSIRKVQTNFWPLVGFGSLAALIGSVGVFVFGFGLLVSIPLQICILTVGYREVFN